ncbi:hypothetical protein EN814_23985 [Mesorhizobium sp. M2D.F.Ca.ET.171.01.1.1]|uniref:hypothetical protein n=1 Tax=unclassified Mesorhizobium TaxID=325217 RepID=UPI001091BC9E|nr:MULTISPECIES: hypothetical protein [unclassified Mesorhizobium]TGS92705.1 hypothetical protein EN821_24000 [Mesorhizobium sp. M2D.F.Ca.ET.178.01.1.1]TGT08510.1 hypothetical protein EN814_23985 [Mesorhizobium sp. M2D.F.Ca.ET.171.01.1.1]
MESRDPPINFHDPADPKSLDSVANGSGTCAPLRLARRSSSLGSLSTMPVIRREFLLADIEERSLDMYSALQCLVLWPNRLLLAFRCWEALRWYPFSGRYLFSPNSVDTRWRASASGFSCDFDVVVARFFLHAGR